MNIDFTVGDSSKKYGYLDVPYRQGAQHFCLALAGKEFGLTVWDRLYHAFCLLKFIPILGHILAGIDIAIHSKTVKIVDVSGIKDPFERGKKFAKQCKGQIREVYSVVLSQKRTESLQKASKEYERQIPKSLLEEMRGIAEGSGYTYEDVLLVHTFLDADPGDYGCTAMARKVERFAEERIAAANHSIRNPIPVKKSKKMKQAKKQHKNIEIRPSTKLVTGSTGYGFLPKTRRFEKRLKNVSGRDDFSGESAKRRYHMLTAKVPEGSPEKALLASAQVDTIQSIVFDTDTLSIKLSASGKEAAKKTFREVSPFKTKENPLAKKKIQVMRNLDWPWHFLGQNSIVLVRQMASGKKSTSITFPGYLGSLSGMNEDGLALSICSRGFESNRKGVPNPLLFTAMLESCSTVDEATRFLEKHEHGSSMNVVIGDKDSAVSLELSGKGSKFIVAEKM